MLDPTQLEVARDWLHHLRHEVQVFLNPGETEDSFAKELLRVAEQLVFIAGSKLRALPETRSSHRSRPSIRVANITYLAVPTAGELEPFLDLLVALSESSPLPEESDLSPALVELLIAPTCPVCPKVVAVCISLAARWPQVELAVIDAQHFQELAGSCHSVPTLIIDHARTIVGAVTEEELLRLLREREKPTYFFAALSSMIETGRLTEAVPLLRSESGLQSMARLLLEGTMQERMGLMLLTEQALEAEPHCLDGALPYLLPLLEEEDATLRGDTADLLGKIGAPGAKEALTRLLEDENPDVRDVASDSLDRLRQPS